MFFFFKFVKSRLWCKKAQSIKLSKEEQIIIRFLPLFQTQEKNLKKLARHFKDKTHFYPSRRLQNSWRHHPVRSSESRHSQHGLNFLFLSFQGEEIKDLSWNTWTAIEFHPHWYMSEPLYRQDPNVARCDWRAYSVVYNGISVLISKEHLKGIRKKGKRYSKSILRFFYQPYDEASQMFSDNIFFGHQRFPRTLFKSFV